MVAERRQFEGVIPLETMSRLRDSLADVDGACRFSLEFGRDALQVAYVALTAEVDLPLMCQRSLERFLLPVQVTQRLGLIAEEVEEAALPPGYEPLLTPRDGQLCLVDMVEDELLLALPVVPVAPATGPVQREWPPTQQERQTVSPFSVLTELKKK
ncbi:MAG: YceD family protein [Xanthomonadaceae bacterium]|jgi:uncharacterized protein|nr:YceD family protein [Xanthomonadaceae bacterium]